MAFNNNFIENNQYFDVDSQGFTDRDYTQDATTNEQISKPFQSISNHQNSEIARSSDLSPVYVGELQNPIMISSDARTPSFSSQHSPLYPRQGEISSDSSYYPAALTISSSSLSNAGNSEISREQIQIQDEEPLIRKMVRANPEEEEQKFVQRSVNLPFFMRIFYSLEKPNVNKMMVYGRYLQYTLIKMIHCHSVAVEIRPENLQVRGLQTNLMFTLVVLEKIFNKLQPFEEYKNLTYGQLCNVEIAQTQFCKPQIDRSTGLILTHFYITLKQIQEGMFNQTKKMLNLYNFTPQVTIQIGQRQGNYYLHGAMFYKNQYENNSNPPNVTVTDKLHPFEAFCMLRYLCIYCKEMMQKPTIVRREE